MRRLITVAAPPALEVRLGVASVNAPGHLEAASAATAVLRRRVSTGRAAGVSSAASMLNPVPASA